MISQAEIEAPIDHGDGDRTLAEVFPRTTLALGAEPYQEPKAAKSTQASAGSATAKLIDINTASQDELKSLRGRMSVGSARDGLLQRDPITQTVLLP